MTTAKAKPARPAYSSPTQEECLQAYEKIAIHRVSREISRDLEIVASRMSKQYKYITGSRAIKLGMCIGEQIAAAYEAKKPERKIKKLKKLKKYCRMLIQCLRTANDVGQVARSDYANIVTKVVSVRRQCLGWMEKIKGSIPKISHTQGQNPARSNALERPNISDYVP